jgi:cell division protein FtsB
VCYCVPVVVGVVGVLCGLSVARVRFRFYLVYNYDALLVLLLVLLVAGVIYVLRYLSAAFARKPVAGEDLEAEIRRLKARVEELERKGAKGG